MDAGGVTQVIAKALGNKVAGLAGTKKLPGIKASKERLDDSAAGS